MQVFRLGSRTIDLRAAIVSDDSDNSNVATLSPIEVRLLDYLASRSGLVVAREELLVEVWEYRPGVLSRTIDNTTSRLRVKIERVPTEPQFLHTVYGQGLRLDGVDTVDVQAAGPNTRFIGRATLLADLQRLIREGRRLVTVLGPGGAGKSRLVDEMSVRIGLDTVRISCRTIQTADELDSAVLRELHIAGTATGAARILARQGQMVLLDECEGCVAAVADRVSVWLSAGPRVRVVATSRVPLQVLGEQRFPVGPLEPDDAAALFVDRALARAPELTLLPEDVAAIVAEVDHLPLAIELAAARVSLLGSARLREMLARPLDVLRTTSGESMERVIERSWVLLSLPEQSLLRQLAVFEAPFDLDSAVGLTGLDRARVLDGIDSLVGQSLIRTTGPDRFMLFTVVRDWARRDRQPRDEIALHHARWFARLGEPSLLERAKVNRSLRLKILDAAADLRAGVEAVDRGVAAQCLLGLAWIALEAGPVEPTLAQLGRFDASEAQPRVQVWLGYMTAQLCYLQAEYREAIEAIEAIWPLVSDPDDVVHLRCLLATLRRSIGDVEGSLRELALARPFAERAGLPRAKWLQASAIYLEPANGDEQLKEAISIAHRFGDRYLESTAALLLAGRQVRQHADWSGLRTFERLWDATRDHLTARGRALIAAHAAWQTLHRGDLEGAEVLAEEAAELSLQLGLVATLGLARCAIAWIWGLRGRHEDALALAEEWTTRGGESEFAPALAWLTIARIELLRGDRGAARRSLVLAERLARAGSWEELLSEVGELMAAIDGDLDGLARAEALFSSAVCRARRQCIKAVIIAERGAPGDAASALEAARAALASCDLLPDAELFWWLQQVQLKVAANG